MARFRVTLVGDELFDDLQLLTGLIAEQRAFFARVIELRRSEGLAAASELVGTGKGKQLMDAIRLRLGEMQGWSSSACCWPSRRSNGAAGPGWRCWG